MLPRIETIRAQLRPSERKLADFVLAAPREVLDLSMTELAARAASSVIDRSSTSRGAASTKSASLRSDGRSWARIVSIRGSMVRKGACNDRTDASIAIVL